MAMLRRLNRELRRQGKRLADWLNYGRERNGDKSRVKEILMSIEALQRALRPGTPAWRIPEVQQMERALDKLTSYYRSWPRFGVSSDSRYITVVHMWERGSLEETEHLRTIEALMKVRAVARFTMCAECKTRWVFRSKSDEKYCGRQCRQARYERTDKRIAQKKKHNQEYYQRWLKRKRRREHGKR
jgi:hypothetical protein